MGTTGKQLLEGSLVSLSDSVQMYYGVTLEVTSMRGDVYLNHFLGFVVEAPAILGTIFAVSRVGRRSCAAALLLEGEWQF